MTKYNIYLDDIRNPKELREFVVLRSMTAATEYVTAHGFPTYISFDHDLAEELTGYDFAKWLVELDMQTNTMPADFEFNVHSANPVGAANITAYLNNYIAFKNANN